MTKRTPPPLTDELTREPGKALKQGMPVNFLLSCSDKTLASFELTRLASVANLRSELFSILDKIIDEQAQAALAAWFRTQDRESLKEALENPPDVIAAAKAELRRRDRQPEEGQGLLPSPSLFRPALPPGKAHLAAALRYQQRNIEAGKCRYCPKPLDRNSVETCTEHLTKARERARVKAMQGGKPLHGRAPGTLKVLEEGRAKRMRTTPEERALWDRVAKQLSMSPIHIRNVATGVKRSPVVTALLRRECEQHPLPHLPKGKPATKDSIYWKGRKRDQPVGRGEAPEKRPGNKYRRKNTALLKLLKGEEVSEE